MLDIKFYDDVVDERLKFAVIVSQYKNKWVFCKHKDRSTYECPGGHRESGEIIEDTAKRELWEETGANSYELTPICVYSVCGCFGYDVTFEERYKLIREAGFDSVMLWWSDKFGRGIGYQKDVQFARDAGLYIDNIHTPVHEQNFIALDNQDGLNVFETYMQCVKDCNKYSIPTMVIHLPNDTYPISELGMNRFQEIVVQAEQYNVNVAFENLANIKNLSWILDTIQSKYAGFCYDSCHHINYDPETDLLKKYGDKLMALHLQDNGGKYNKHQLPYDGISSGKN